MFATSTCQAAVPHTRKYILRMITSPVKLRTRHLQDHPPLLDTAVNHIEPAEHNYAAFTYQRDSTNELHPRLLLSTDSSTVSRIFPPVPNPIPYSVIHNTPSRYPVLLLKFTDTASTIPIDYPSQVSRLAISISMYLKKYIQTINLEEVISIPPSSPTLSAPTSDIYWQRLSHLHYM